MAITSNTYTGNGTNKLFSITFPYLDESDINVYLNGTLQTITTQYFFANATTVEFVTAPPVGAAVLLDRSTDDTNLQATFFPGSSIKAADLNFNFDQVLYLAQETANSAANQSTAGLQTQITAATNTANNANTTANTANATANAANATANGIAGTAASAVTTANNAVTTANNAVNTANSAVTTANGAVTTANSALATVTGLTGVNLNLIINGNFDIWQRGTSHSTAGYGSADRWFNAISGSTATMSRQAFTLGQTAVPGEPTYFCRAAVTSVAGAANYVLMQQRIEDVRTFAGQQVTVSFWAKADASKPICVELAQGFGTGGTPSAEVNFGATKTTLSTNWQKITVTTAVPSISGKTLGSNEDHSLRLNIWFDAGSSYNARTNSLGQQSGTFDIAQVQVEAGAAATPFERRPIGTELALCQRYYEVKTGRVVTSAKTSISDYVQWAFKVTKRAIPTIVAGGGSSWSGVDAATVDGLGVLSFNATAGIIDNGTTASAEL